MTSIAVFLVVLFGVTWPLGYFVTPLAMSGGTATFLAVLLPTVWMPTILALAITWFTRGAGGIRSELRARLTYRSGALLLAAAACVPFAAGLVAMFAARGAGDSAPFIPSNAILQSVVIQIITGGTGEELGWRGFLLPRLRTLVGERGAAIAMSLLWASWHVPAFYTPGMPHQFMPMGSMLTFIALFGFFLATLFRASGGSVIPTMVAHISVNIVFGIGGANLASVVFWRTMAAIFGVCALVALPRFRTLTVATATAVLSLVLVSMTAAAQSATTVGDVAWSIATLTGRQIAYLDSGGSGVPIVFMHAGSGSSVFWERQIPVVRAAGYRFIAFDRVGSGRSVLDSGADPGSAADDLQSVANLLKLERFHLVGTAAGGIVSTDYALSFPDRLRSLVLANSVGGVQDPDYVALGQRLRPSPQFDALPTEFKELGPSYRAANPEGMARWVELEHASRPPAPQARPQRNRNPITFSRLETMRVPTLLLTGDADLYTPPAVLRLFAARMRGAESFVVTEAGHSVYWERADAFNQAVLAFVAKH